MQFKIKDGVDIFELNPWLQAFPEFTKLEGFQMKTVALYADYESPLRTKPDKERRELAAKIGGYGMESDNKRLNKNGRSFVAGETKSLEEAIAVYREIQYDETQDIFDAYNQQIQEIIQLMKTAKIKETESKDVDLEALELALDLSEKASKLSVKLPAIKKAKKEIQELMNIKDNEPELKGYVTPSDIPQDDKNTLSALDMYMQTQMENK
jgi:small-conductance mechanosensitive channel